MGGPTPATPSVSTPATQTHQGLPEGFVATGNRIYAMAFEGEGKAVLTLSGAYTEEDLDDLKAATNFFKVGLANVFIANSNI